MIYDRYNNAITSDQPDLAAVFDRYTQTFLAYGPALPDIIAHADREPGCVSLNAHAAAVHMAYEAASGYRAALPYLQRAKAGVDRVTPRERLFVEAVAAWAAQDFDTVIALHRKMARQWPEDLAASKWGQYHAFNLGRSDHLLEIAEHVVDALGEEPYVHGMRAFALEQSHRLDEAEDSGRRAIEIERVDPWAHHAVAHVMETHGRAEEGLSWMRSLSETWSRQGVFIRHHNWWHVALFHLDLDDPLAALDVYDRYLWGVLPDFCQEQIGAISALWRLELRGADVGARWEQVIAKVSEREFEHVQPFHDLHYVYALGRGGHWDLQRAFLTSMARRAGTATGCWARVWREVALPAAEGLALYTQDQFADAADRLGPLLERLALIGGSHAQRDIFHQTHIDALIRSGQSVPAARLLEKRAEARPEIACVHRQLAAVRDPSRNPVPVS